MFLLVVAVGVVILLIAAVLRRKELEKDAGLLLHAGPRVPNLLPLLSRLQLLAFFFLPLVAAHLPSLALFGSMQPLFVCIVGVAFLLVLVVF